MNFLRDLIDANRGHHATVRSIVDLHPREVEIKVAPQGFLLDVVDPLRLKIRATIEKNHFEFTPQVSRLTEETYPSADFYPGHVDENLERDWFASVESWPTHLGKAPGEIDFLHIESHLLGNRTVFLTRDKPLREMCRLLEEKSHGPIGAISPDDFLAQFLDRP